MLRRDGILCPYSTFSTFFDDQKVECHTFSLGSSAPGCECSTDEISSFNLPTSDGWNSSFMPTQRTSNSSQPKTKPYNLSPFTKREHGTGWHPNTHLPTHRLIPSKPLPLPQPLLTPLQQHSTPSTPCTSCSPWGFQRPLQ